MALSSYPRPTICHVKEKSNLTLLCERVHRMFIGSCLIKSYQENRLPLTFSMIIGVKVHANSSSIINIVHDYYELYELIKMRKGTLIMPWSSHNEIK